MKTPLEKLESYIEGLSLADVLSLEESGSSELFGLVSAAMAGLHGDPSTIKSLQEELGELESANDDLRAEVESLEDELLEIEADKTLEKMLQKSPIAGMTAQDFQKLREEELAKYRNVTGTPYPGALQ